jgi:ABC-type cobalamin transport system ATPase subunit
VVLQPCSGRVRAGRLLGVLGPSGAGKTTALGAIVDGVPAERRKRFKGWLAGTSARLAGGKVALLSQERRTWPQPALMGLQPLLSSPLASPPSPPLHLLSTSRRTIPSSGRSP